MSTADSKRRSRLTPAQTRILRVLEDQEWTTASEIRERLGERSRAGITTALRNLKRGGWVIESDPGGADWYRERNYQHADWASRFAGSES